ncbi:hypothetical protein C9374_003790 [Naegleria lovaniensis]|uniref:Uncharacterized protein n=1 Tax=Naegleria lovaniensis TaxID=51637 RepID=A0AA88KSA5_NAELO|nr:uncharacterized protein C9374_003790 [Naegleria lovaniensis]KAG2394026.1 hypothetical protein C9374_003790 [Naegleria lovaniensis]
MQRFVFSHRPSFLLKKSVVNGNTSISSFRNTCGRVIPTTTTTERSFSTSILCQGKSFEKLLSSIEKDSGMKKSSKKHQRSTKIEESKTSSKGELKQATSKKQDSQSEPTTPVEIERKKQTTHYKQQELEAPSKTAKKSSEPTFKIIDKSQKRNEINDESLTAPIADYTASKLHNKELTSKLQKVVNTEDDVESVIEWGKKHDLRLNYDQLLTPTTSKTQEEIEKARQRLKKSYEEYVQNVSIQEEENKIEDEQSLKLYSEQITNDVPKGFEVFDSSQLSTKPHKKTDMEKLAKQLASMRKKISPEEAMKRQLVGKSQHFTESLREEKKQTDSPTTSAPTTTVLNLTDEQYNNAMNSLQEFTNGWKEKGYDPVLQNNFGRKILILYPTSKKKQQKKQLKEAQQASNDKKLHDLLDEVSMDEEQTNTFEKTMSQKLVDVKQYFSQYGYDISDLKSLLKTDSKKQTQEKTKSMEPTRYSEEIQREIENHVTDDGLDSSILLDEYLGDDDPNQVFQTVDQKNLLVSEYEEQTQHSMFSPDIQPYLKRSSKENEERLRQEIANMSIGSIQLPRSLVEGVTEIISEYPKNLIQRTAELLSAAFRIRTSGFEKNASSSTFSKLDEEKKLNKPNHQDELFKEQLDILKKLRSFQRTSKKKKRPIDIEMMKKESEAEMNRSYNPQIIYKELEAAAYIAHRLPAIYGTSYRVFSESVMRMPDFEPKTMLDFGTGPGTTIWAAMEAFGSLKEVMAVEPSTAMMDVATRLFDYMEEKPQITWRRFLNENSSKQYDLVVASFVLNELANAQERERIVKALWKATSGLLVIIEPGTPVGFNFIREARSTVLSQKSHENDKPIILAPCPHDSVCPMSGTPKWCHFAQRIDREAFQKLTKQAKKHYENENYSFIAIKRESLKGFEYSEQVEKEEEEAMRAKQIEEQLPDSVVTKEISLRRELRSYSREFSQQSFRWPRIIDTPLKRGGHAITSMCLPEGTLSKIVISKADSRKGYKYLRKCLKGDLYPYPLRARSLKKNTELEKYFQEDEP